MEFIRIKKNTDIILIAIIVVFVDMLLKSHLLGSNVNIFFNAVIVLIAGILGKGFAKSAGIPVWKFNYKDTPDRKNLIIAIMLGLSMVAYNTYSIYYSDISSITWLNFSNVFQPILLSLRAALSEEIQFRLFIFTAITAILKGVTKSKMIPMAAGMLISSLLFGLIHPGFLMPFLYGTLLCYIYRYNGLAVVMIIHFLADAIPFTILFMR